MATKEEIASVKARNLIASFEKGDVTQNGNVIDAEKPIARPGAAKKLQQVYEDKSKPEQVPAVTKGPSLKKSPTVHTRQGDSSSVAKQKIGPKNVLIVFAHWERKSFNGALLDSAIKSLEKAGHKVTVSDLYGMNWKAAPSKDDIKGGPRNKDFFNYLDETMNAAQDGNLAQDIADEHRKMKEADLIIFQFPIHWFGFPTMLKGWFDRCITNGVAFNTEKGQLFDTGLLKGTKAVLSFTTGGKNTAYSNSGINGDMNVILWPMQLLLRFVGFDVLAPQISFNVFHTDVDTRKEYLSSWGTRLDDIFHETPLKFIPLRDFSMEKGLILTKESDAMKKAKEGFGVTVGQNLGKPYPPNSMQKPDM